MIISNDKYNMTELTVSYYSAQMKLTIRKLKKSDLGGYKCISKNSIGEAEGNIRVYGKTINFSFLMRINELILYLIVDPINTVFIYSKSEIKIITR